MADITISIPTPLVSRVVDAFAGQYGYKTTIPNPQNPNAPEIPNPVSKSQFATNVVKSFVKEVVKAYEANTEAEKARKRAFDLAEKDIQL